jgi:drug/metabolite transporter (DMT)-like permease
MNATGRTSDTAAILKLIASVTLWGGTWVSGRVLAQEMAPFPAAFLRFLVASAFLFFLTARIEGRFPRIRPGQLPAVLLLGLTGVFAYNAFFFGGLRTVTASRAALIIAAIPSLLAFFSAVFFGERLTGRKVLGVTVSLAGAAVVISRGNPAALLAGGLARGDLYILGCVASWTAYSLAGKKVMESLSPFAAVTWSCIAGDALLLVPALYTGLLGEISGAGLMAWGNIAYLGVAATGIAFSWYYAGIKALGASRAGVFINLVPVVAVILASLILGEVPDAAVLIGGAVVIAGVYVTNRPPRKKNVPPEPV